ncbi:sugar transferase, partial [Deinococcus sp.]|uniref:sugar transferase n=1 Tax=Deinococcus sp. TaxID=47478 RepID=UPI0025F21EA7
LLLIAIAIKLDSPGPAVYRARRLGRDGKLFDCFKFRSMHRDAEAKLREVLDADPELRIEFDATHKLRNDPRVTRVGNILRKTSLDEFPQLFNVIIGEMSLVGPRPIVQAEVIKYGEIYSSYKQVRPGMTGYWQANGRSDTSYDERVAMDNFYVTNWTPWLDLVILLQTVRVVLMGKGAY